MKQRERMEELLPLKTEYGFIRGFIPDEWQVKMRDDDISRLHMTRYRKCCLDPRNWEGTGEWREIDPKWQAFEGGYASRDVHCKECSASIIAHETRTNGR